MKLDGYIYVVIEGGGVDFEPTVLGLFDNETLAKDCLKEAMTEFLEDSADESAVVIKELSVGQSTFRVYQDAGEVQYGACLNTFAIFSTNLMGKQYD